MENTTVNPGDKVRAELFWDGEWKHIYYNSECKLHTFRPDAGEPLHDLMFTISVASEATREEFKRHFPHKEPKYPHIYRVEAMEAFHRVNIVGTARTKAVDMSGSVRRWLTKLLQYFHMA
jgi:hypothetical protein